MIDNVMFSGRWQTAQIEDVGCLDSGEETDNIVK